MQPHVDRPDELDAVIPSGLLANTDLSALVEGVVVSTPPLAAHGGTGRYDNIDLALRLGFLFAIILTVVGLVVSGFSVAAAIGIIVAAGLAGLALLRRLGR